jgi:hypothetical protein
VTSNQPLGAMADNKKKRRRTKIANPTVLCLQHMHTRRIQKHCSGRNKTQRDIRENLQDSNVRGMLKKKQQ